MSEHRTEITPTLDGAYPVIEHTPPHEREGYDQMPDWTAYPMILLMVLAIVGLNVWVFRSQKE